MLRNQFAVLAASVALFAASTAGAFYSSAPVGTGTGYYFQDWCTKFHGGERSRVSGIEGVYDTQTWGDLWYMTPRCEGGGGPSNYRGINQSVSVDTFLLCPSGAYVNHLWGYHFPGGVWSLSGSCKNSSGNESALNGEIGVSVIAWLVGGSYSSVRCSGSDVAWGFWGAQETSSFESRIKRIGMICNRY